MLLLSLLTIFNMTHFPTIAIFLKSVKNQSPNAIDENSTLLFHATCCILKAKFNLI